MIATREMRDAWEDFKKKQAKSKRDFNPSATCFCAGWNRAMESVNNPQEVKTRIGYVVVNYNLYVRDYPAIMQITDPFGVLCIIVDDSFSTYLTRDQNMTSVGIYETRQDARREARDNNEEEPDSRETVWKVEVDSKNNIIRWLKKNP